MNKVITSILLLVIIISTLVAYDIVSRGKIAVVEKTLTVTETFYKTTTVTTTQTKVIYVGYPENYSHYGGWLQLRANTTGFFHVEVINGIYWFVDPEGYVFISKGVNAVNYMGDYAPALGYSPYHLNILYKYKSIDRWIEVTVSRLIRWGFNTIGAWSSNELHKYLPYTINLNILGNYGFDWVTGKMPDIFAESFVDYAERKAYFNCKPLSSDPLLIGYFLDNELRWGPDWRSDSHLLDDFIKLPSSAPGKRVVVEVVKSAYDSDISLLNRDLGTTFSTFNDLLEYYGPLPLTTRMNNARFEFLKRYAERYFSITANAIKRYDSNHLILGIRFAGLPKTMYEKEVFRIMARYVDVISVNIYNVVNPPRQALIELHEATGKPIMVTEFSFRARDSGLPNTKGAGLTFNTQTERANATQTFISELVSLPFVIGYHWFKYEDQPKEGRFDGENSNYGLVRIDDEPYIEMVEMFTKLNMIVEKIHLGLE